MSSRGGRREGSGRKKLDVCKSKRIRISEDLFERWKDLKRIRNARSDEDLVSYLLDLATATFTYLLLSASSCRRRRRLELVTCSVRDVAIETLLVVAIFLTRTRAYYTIKLHSRRSTGHTTASRAYNFRLPCNSTFNKED